VTESCVFCRIERGELPSDRVYEDDRVIAFRDINPQAPVHVLIIPRKHIASLADLTPGDTELAGHMLRVAQQLAEQLGIRETGYRVVTNCGRDGGQVVFHLHFHLVGGKPLGRFA